MSQPRFNRRDFLKLSAAGVLSGVSVPWFESLAQAAAIRRPRGKACILLWMDGGPSQQHTFDPKPRRRVPLRRHDRARHPHRRATAAARAVHERPGDPPLDEDRDQRPLRRQVLPAHRLPARHRVRAPRHRLHRVASARHAERRHAGVRHHRRRLRHATTAAGSTARCRPISARSTRRSRSTTRAGGWRTCARPAAISTHRLEMLAGSEQRFAQEYPLPAVGAQQAAFDRAVRLMRSPRSRAFNLDDEPASMREAYGPHGSASRACWRGGWSRRASPSSRSSTAAGTITTGPHET